MKSQIKILNDEVSELLSELYEASTQRGIHLDNNLETGLFMLLLDENYNEMYLLKNRIKLAIKQIKNGTFEIKEVESILHTQKVA